MNDTEALRRELLDKLRILRNNCEGNKKPSIISLLRTISKYACEGKIEYLLGKPELDDPNERFDLYYKLKSDFATLKILDLLKSRLSADGLNVTVLTEMPSETGRYDVAIIQGDPCEVYTANAEKVRVEIKASQGLDFEQLDRYLWDSSPLILARVITGHVAKLRPSKLKPYVRFSLKELNTKVDRLLSGKAHNIPGKECTYCYNVHCPHSSNRDRSWKTSSIITMSDAEFDNDLNMFFQNLSYVAKRTVSLIIEELDTVPMITVSRLNKGRE